MTLPLLLAVLGCSDSNSYDVQLEPPGLSLSPKLETMADIAPGDSVSVVINLDNIGGRDGDITVELVEHTGVGLSLDTSGVPENLLPDERVELEVTYAPDAPGVAIGYIHATILGADDCEEAWSVVRANAIDDTCDPDDLDCDGQTSADGDCDDDNPFNAIALPEICDGKDNNCDGSADPDCSAGQCGHPPPP